MRCVVDAQPGKVFRRAAMVGLDALDRLHHGFAPHREQTLGAHRVHAALDRADPVARQHVGELHAAQRVVVGDRVGAHAGEQQRESNDDPGAVLAGVAVDEDRR